MIKSLWDDIVDGKYNLSLFFIFSIFIFHLYYKLDCVKESMTDTDINSQIKEAVKQLYASDVEAIRNLSEVAIKLQKEGLTIPGNLIVAGSIVSKGDITVGEKDKSDGKITLINKQGGTGLFMSSNYQKLGGSIYLYAPENLEGKSDFKNHIHYNSSTLMVKGMILAWSGDKAPEGWALCDGQNETPDLRGRFILAAGQGIGLTNRVGQQIGGEENVILTVDQMPAHSHTHNAFHANFKHSGDATEGSTKRDCCGSFKVTSDLTGGNQPHNNMPPYYVLAYIMKL